MSFYDRINRLKSLDIDGMLGSASRQDVERAIYSENPGEAAFATLLSPEAEKYLELMAERSREITLRNFGRTIQLYTPMYLANHCDNHCLYCGFRQDNDFERRRLSMDEVRREAEAIAATGLKHILILTGDSRRESPVSYIRDCVKILREYFSSISIEVYALTEEEYRELVDAGVDGLTIYQETYDEDVYEKLHPSGPKRNYVYRLDAPERGARAGMRNVSIGVLLGLNDWRREALVMGLHAGYILDKYPDVEVGVAIPRIRPHAGDFKPACVVSDRNVVQLITALRIFIPRLAITVSTRESAALRENIMPLGVTRMSAGSTTTVGGHSIVKEDGPDVPQFEICDERSVGDMKLALERKGYQPVLKDWMGL